MQSPRQPCVESTRLCPRREGREELASRRTVLVPVVVDVVMVKAYDPRCRELADIFLQEYQHTPADAAELAWAIQDTIESYTSGLEPKLIAPSA